MKKYTNAELKKIFDDINAGAVYVGICNGHGVGEISSNCYYIKWKHYGSSAQKATVDNLRFILECIFNDCDEITPAVYSKYHCNYIPVNKKYRGIDHSWMHPNVYGL
jgi:hypothetical protein